MYMTKEKIRCGWCLKDDLYKKYHDEEWGKPVKDDTILFEFLILESFQAGLSWYTVLKKRENFRKAFKNFDAKKIATFTQADIDRLMADAGIIRNKLKIEAAINNAKLFLELQKQHGSFAHFIWKFTNHKSIVNHPKTLADLKPTSEISDLMSKELGKLGFKFRGSTICYAFMQAVGMVDDHIEDCWLKK
ncbi:MAG: hypothetical protein RIQ33_1989 [Bacteroidota bacterium]